MVGFAVPELVARFYGEINSGFGLLLTGAAHGQMPLWLVSSIGSGVMVVAVLVRFWGRIGRSLSFLVPAGQMALTLYVAHLLVLAVIRPADDFTFPTGIATSIAMIAAFTLLAVAWQKKLGTGPLERLLRARWLDQLAVRK